MNGLALGVEERVGLPSGLLGCEPTKGGAVFGGRVVDVYVDLVPLFVDGRRDRDVEGSTEGTALSAESVVDLLAFDVDRVDLEVACVEDDGSDAGLNKLDDMRDATRDGASVPVDAPIEVQVERLVLGHLGVGVDILRHAQGGCTDRGRIGRSPGHGCERKSRYVAGRLARRRAAYRRTSVWVGSLGSCVGEKRSHKIGPERRSERAGGMGCAYKDRNGRVKVCRQHHGTV